MELEHGQTGLWRLGPIRLFIRRSPSEWRFVYGYGEDRHDDTFEWTCPAEPESPEEDGAVELPLAIDPNRQHFLLVVLELDP